MFQDQVVWDGEVEVFDLTDSPEASRVYAWAHDTDTADQPRRTVTVLHVPPVTSPEKVLKHQSLGTIVSEKKSTKRMGHPKLPKGQAKGRIVPVRFTEAELKAIAKAVKASEQNTLLAWLRQIASDATSRGTSNVP